MSKPTNKTLSIDVLVLDGGTQSRKRISEHTVERYVETLEAATEAGKTNWPFKEPIVVFHDGSQYLVASGFHRTLAARRHGRASVPCEIHQGTAWDALLFGMGANHDHGLPPSDEDNRHSIEILLDSPKRFTHKEIASIVQVSTRTVRRVVAARKASSQDDDDPFDIDDSHDADAGEDSGTDSGTDGQHDPPPGSTDTSGEPSKDKPEDFEVLRSRAVKTAEALVRAFDALNRQKRRKDHEDIIESCQKFIGLARNW